MLISCLSPLCLLALTQAPSAKPPPGLVLIPGGPTWIGTERALVEQIGKENAARIQNLACETPQFQRQVEPFYLGVTEVTNEQFAEYVKATGHRPPDSWGIKAIEAASNQYAMEVGIKKKEARDAGRPIPEFPKFNQAQWWNDHWREAAWELPAGSETLPVGYVDYREAESYARWSGLRLMTEFEFQRAARGSAKQAYPWGDEWDPKRCAAGGQGLKTAMPVGSYPGGKTSQGVFDLSGNVWEWTSSPFTEYPGFKIIQIRRKDQTIDAMVNWNSGQRVVVGGSYQESANAARIATRRPTDQSQSAEALGMRLAASPQAGLDVATAMLLQESDHLPVGVTWDATKAVICDRWLTAKGKADVPGYSVITGYDHVVFVPAVGLDYTSLGQLELSSIDRGPVPVGVLESSKPMLSPPLPAGAYAVALRGPAPLRRHESIRGPDEDGMPAEGSAPPTAGDKQGIQGQDEKPKPTGWANADPVSYPAGFKPEQSNLLFYDKELRIVAAIHTTDVEFAVPKPTSVSIEPTVIDLSKDGVELREAAVAVKLKVNAWVKVSNKCVTCTIGLVFKPTDVTPDWRR